MPHAQHRGGKGRGRGRGGNRGGRGRGNAAALPNVGDIELECRDCRAKFFFTARAQVLHSEQGFTGELFAMHSAR
eukprot:COSAG05_NODE_9085_length_649_cov_0.849091_1_plen_74_part_10